MLCRSLRLQQISTFYTTITHRTPKVFQVMPALSSPNTYIWSVKGIGLAPYKRCDNFF